MASALETIRRGAADVFPQEELLRKLESGRRLRVKLGVDPTAADLHLGFTVVLRKLRQFQELGHQAVLIIGDYTALVGDPTGRDVTRPRLESTKVAANAATYLEQAARVLDMSRLEVRRNSEWFAGMTFLEVLELCGKMTVARLLERDDFQQRHQAGVPIALHEFLYPLMQGHDSVVIGADIELGGSDQRYNLVVGRNLQREVGQEPQVCLTMPLLVGTCGVKKMSKSYGNYVGIAEPPKVMYDKLLSIPDPQARDYLTLLTDISAERIARLTAPGADARAAKVELALDIVRQYHGPQAAAALAGGDAPLPALALPRSALDGSGRIWIVDLLKAVGFAATSSDARRLIVGGAVILGETAIADAEARVTVSDGLYLKAGKRRFGRLSLA